MKNIRLRFKGVAAAFTVQGILAQPVITQPVTVDFEKSPFVTQLAPSLKFERRLTPRLNGINYPFEEQTARGVALFSRFPPFTLSDRRIHLSGPWYSVTAANEHFSRGITSIEAMPNFRQGATDVRQLPASHKWQLMTDPLFWGYAERIANEIAAADSKDERIAPLRTFATDHKFTPDEAAFTELGRRVWIGERLASDENGQGVLYPCIDIEQTGGWEHQRACFGWIYKGMAQAAAQNGARMVPISYGQWTFEVGAVHFSMRQNGTGEPEYLLPDKDFLATPDPTIQATNANHGVISMDGYMQAIWGHEPFYKRQEDGSLRLVDGKPVFNDIRQTSVYGQTISLEEGEAEHCLQDLYRQAVRMYLMHHRFAGQYPSNSTLRKSFLQNARIGAWTRITNEGLQGIQQNDRPLPGWLIEMLCGLYLFTADDLVVWSSDTNTPPGVLGADYSRAWKYNSHGVVEFIVKAAHRYSALEPLHQTNAPFEWCWFNLPMVNKNQSAGDRYEQKPLVFGKIRTFEGKPWLELFAAYPALDNQSGEFKIWLEKDGLRSAAYTAHLADGRSYFYDAWQLPPQFTGAQGKHVWLRFKDQLGQTRTLRGDWRVAVDQNMLAPSDYHSDVLR